MSKQSTDSTHVHSRAKRCFQQTDRVQVLKPLAICNIRLSAGDILCISRIHKENFQASRVEYLHERNPPGRRWRTELPRCWPPSAAQTWCAVFPRHAFTKARF